jgi:hypothetical protein
MTGLRINEPDTTDGAPNFQRDLGQGVADLLRAEGFTVPVDALIDDVMIMFVNSRFRYIPAARRPAVWSRELRARGGINRHVLQGVRRLEKASAAGLALGPFQSTTLLDGLFADKLFNEWRIHHFHLDLPGGNATKPGFVKRAAELLFAMATPTELLLIDVRDHGAFADKQLFEIVHRNWPDAVVRWRLHGVSDADIIDHGWARKARLSIPTVLSDGAVYMNLGGGCMLDRRGTAAVVRSEADQVRNYAQALEDCCLRHTDQFRHRAAEMGRPVDTPRFRLRVDQAAGDTRWALNLVPYEEQTSITITFRDATEDAYSLASR